MAASSVDALPEFLEEAPGVAAEMNPQFMVLDPVRPRPGFGPVLLQDPQQIIGGEAACSIQLADAGIRGRHAAIFRRRDQFIVKAWDPRTWINCDPVTESPLREGDLLTIGPVEFRVRAATTDEVLRGVPAVEACGEADDAAAPAGRLELRRARLAAIRARLKERRAELECESKRLRDERSQFESERVVFESQRTARGGDGDGPALAPGAQDLGPSAKMRSDDERFNVLFRKAPRPVSGDDSVSDSAVAQSLPSPEDQKASENAEIADSVADYMEHLLGRMRAARPGGVIADHAAERLASADDEESARVKRSGAADDSNAHDGPRADRNPRKARARSRQNAHEIRAGVGSLRAIANLSARTAVASYTSRKHRQSVAVTLPLSLISFVLAGVLYFLGGIEAKFYSQAFGTVMLGVIVLIELAHSFWKLKSIDASYVPKDLDPAAIAGESVEFSLLPQAPDEPNERLAEAPAD